MKKAFVVIVIAIISWTVACSQAPDSNLTGDAYFALCHDVENEIGSIHQEKSNKLYTQLGSGDISGAEYDRKQGALDRQIARQIATLYYDCEIREQQNREAARKAQEEN